MTNYEKGIVSKKTIDISLWCHINYDIFVCKRHCNMGHLNPHNTSTLESIFSGNIIKEVCNS